MRWTRPVVAVVVLLALVIVAWRWSRSPSTTKRTPASAAPTPTLTASRTGVPASDASEQRRLTGPHRIEGIVLSPDGHGASGATIVISGPGAYRLQADTDGSFAVDGVLATVYRVEARHEQMIAGPVWVRGTSTVEPVVLRLRPTGGIAVLVTDEYGAALAGARVEVAGGDPATTDDLGQANLVGLSADTHAVRVSAAGRAVAVREVDVAAGGTSHVTLALVPAVPLAGTVVDERGAPVAGARVSAAPVRDATMLSTHELGNGVTAEDGTWTLDGIGLGSIVLSAAHEVRRSTPLVLTVPAGGKRDVQISLDAVRTIRGVVRAADGTPARGALVRAGAPLVEGEPSQTLTADDGTFSITGLPPYEWTIVASFDEAVSDATVADLRARHDAEVVLTLVSTLRIEGRVLGSDGAPVAEAQVSAEPLHDAQPDAALLRGPIADLTDSEGRFRLVGFRAQPYALRAAPAGASTSDGSFHRRPALRVEAGTLDVRLVLPADGRMVGRLAAEGGGALSRVQLVVDEDRVEGVAAGVAQFAIESVAPGDHVVEVHADGLAPAIRSKVSVEAGQTVDLGLITLVGGGTVRGTVSDQQGRRLGGARVVAAERVFASAAGSGVLDRVSFARSAQTNVRGEFVVHGVPAQARVLTASHPSVGTSSAYQLRATEREQVIDVVITASGVLRGWVTSGGTPAAGITVMATMGGGAQVATTKTSATGEYRFEQLSAGTYAVTATGDGGVTAAGSVAVPVGGEASLDLAHVRGDLTLEIDVPGAPDGGAVVVARISVDAADKPTLGQVTIAEAVERERFVAKDVEPGPAKICFVGPDKKRTCRRHDLPPTPTRQKIQLALEGAP